MNADQLIHAERQRQIHSEGYDAEHDRDHQLQLLAAADTYFDHARRELEDRVLGVELDPETGEVVPPSTWPWLPRHWKPTDPKRTLVKAGALYDAARDAAQGAFDTNSMAIAVIRRREVCTVLDRILDAEPRDVAPAEGLNR